MTDTFTTTAADVLDGRDLTGTTVVVTGATSGLGLTSATALAAAGADVIVVGRDAARLAEAVAAVDAAGAGIAMGELADLADLDQVRALAGRLRDRVASLDILVCNAGIMAAPLERSAQGHEMQLAVSHLAHHVLVNELLDRLTAANARVVSLSSSAHFMGGVDLDDLDFTTRDYEKWGAYAQAKSATALFAVELANRHGSDGVTSLAVHPGVIKTGIQRHLSDEEEAGVIAMSEAQGDVRSPEAGAASIVWAATAELGGANGSYVANAAIADDLRAPHAGDPEIAAHLWDVTEAMVRPN